MQSQISGPQCPIHKQKAYLICLTCPEPQIICKKCQQVNLHKKHQCINIQEFNSKIPQYNSIVCSDKNVKLLMREIERTRAVLTQALLALQHEVKSMAVKPLQLQGKQYQQSKGQLQNMLKKYPLFKKMLLKQLDNMELEQTEQRKLSYFISVLRRSQNQTIEVFEKVKATFGKEKTQFLQFSQTLKNKYLELKDYTIIRKNQLKSQGHSHIALLSEPFTGLNTSMTVKIKKISENNGLSFGICISEIVKENNFYRCWRLGKGTYGIYINNYGQIATNHHSNQKYNYQLIKKTGHKSMMSWIGLDDSLVISQGDTITVCVKFMEQQVQFYHNNSKQPIVALPVDIGDWKYYGYVGLSYLGDEVELV